MSTQQEPEADFLDHFSVQKLRSEMEFHNDGTTPGTLLDAESRVLSAGSGIEVTDRPGYWTFYPNQPEFLNTLAQKPKFFVREDGTKNKILLIEDCRVTPGDHYHLKLI